MGHKYPSDKELGLKTITQIRNTPAGQLNDQEFVKCFFDRFKAKALIMLYQDEDGKCVIKIFNETGKFYKDDRINS